jgi:hypothetical protein
MGVANQPLDNSSTSAFSLVCVYTHLRLLYSQSQDVSPVQQDHRAQFYDKYRKVADEYDKEFLKKNEEDLDTTLIFVSAARIYSSTD